MPAFTVPTYARLREFNRCHRPRGEAGGQFCDGSQTPGAGTDVVLQPISPNMFRVMDASRGQAIRWKGPHGMRDVFTKAQAERIAKVWRKRRARDVDSFYKGTPGREEMEDFLGWMGGVVGG